MERSEEERQKVADYVADGHGDRWIARNMGITRHRARALMGDLATVSMRRRVEESKNALEVSGCVFASDREHSLSALLEDCKVDLGTWMVDRWVANTWGTPGSLQWQVKAWLKRKEGVQVEIEHLIEHLKEFGPVEPDDPWKLPSGFHKRALEISVADPHFGLRCFQGPSGADWNINMATACYRNAISELVSEAAPFGPFEEIVFVTGNDLLHADNVFHTTTAGTTQPEMDSWHHTVLEVERLMFSVISGLATDCHVHVVMVPGNHARQTEFLFGRVLEAYYHAHARVSVDCGPEPYKFWRYGTNLIGFDHGHSINPVKLGGIMAGERKVDWAETTYREWHLGDQHRKGVSPPSMEELGVSIEFLPSLVPWNEWHKIKGFSQQKRAAVAFVYDYDHGQVAKLQVNHV